MIKSALYAIKSAMSGLAAISSMGLAVTNGFPASGSSRIHLVAVALSLRGRVTIGKIFLRRRRRCLPGHSRHQRIRTNGKLRTR